MGSEVKLNIIRGVRCPACIMPIERGSERMVGPLPYHASCLVAHTRCHYCHVDMRNFPKRRGVFCTDLCERLGLIRRLEREQGKRERRTFTFVDKRSNYDLKDRVA
jgi:hypothetical protein